MESDEEREAALSAFIGEHMPEGTRARRVMTRVAKRIEADGAVTPEAAQLFMRFTAAMGELFDATRELEQELGPES